MTTAATPAHDLEATTAAARRASGRGPAVAGLRGKLLAADGPALRSAAGVPLVTAPTGATPAQLDAFVAEQRRSAPLVGRDPAEAPASVAELDAYHADTQQRARASAEATNSLLMSFNPPAPHS